MDAGHDAMIGDDSAPDAGFDAGPPPTGCHLWTGDAGVEPPDAEPLPDPAAFAPPTGPGAPSTSYVAADLGENCAFLPLGPTDEGHHNTGFFLDGYLVRPWAHERGRGGIAVWDFNDPCNPVLVANVLDEQIRETHATGLSRIGGRWIAVASLSGVQFWDVRDVTAPVMVRDVALEGVRYPDAYMRTVMSVFWQAPYVFVGASDNGIYVLDASDPVNIEPEVIAHYLPRPLFRVGQIVVIGELLYAFSSQGSVSSIIDVRDPTTPRAVAGGTYTVSNGTLDRFGRSIPLPAYFGHVSGGYTFHTRIGLGGGLAIVDVRAPETPSLVGDYDARDGDGGYVFLHEGMAFVGFSDYGAQLDVSDLSNPTLIRRYDLPGDVDTLTPFGNVVIVSVDEDGVDGEASAVVPFALEPDSTPPEVTFVVPSDGAIVRALTTRIGVTFNEFVAMGSVFRGSVVLRDMGSGRIIETHLSGQEGVVNVTPVSVLAPDTEYEFEVRAGGVTDVSGNPITSAFRSTFRTVECAL